MAITTTVMPPRRRLTARPFAPAGVHGCVCCSPALQTLGLLTLPKLASAARPSHWARFGPPPAAPVGAVILANARIHTIDAAFSTAQALAFAGGRLLAVGSLEEVSAAAGEDAEVIDAGGRTVLPGFIEPHMHFFAIAMFGAIPDVGALVCRDADDVIARVGEMAGSAEAGAWIIGRQFDPSLQPGADRITRHTLDQVAPRNPVFLFNASLHIGYCNSAALEAAGVTAETPDPPGASYVRGPDGAPNGVLQGQAAMFSVLGQNLATMAEADLAAACVRVAGKANRVGFTTVCDQATGGFQGRGEIAALQGFAQSGHLTVRMRNSLIQAGERTWDALGLAPGEGDDMVRTVGWKIVSDGSNQGRTGLQREPYLGGGTGMAYVEPDALRDIVVKRALQGWQMVIHANGDLAIDRALDAIEAAVDAGAPADARFRIEHCSVLDDGQIARMARLGVTPSFLIGHVHYWGKAFRDEIFGPAKADRLGRAASCGRAGIRWTMHSDEPVTEMDPLRMIDNAVNRDLWKAPGEVLNPAERVSVRDAIVALTRDAAWQCRSDHEIGTLEAGKLADFVILDRDPLEAPTGELRSIRVLETWVGGRRVWSSASGTQPAAA